MPPASGTLRPRATRRSRSRSRAPAKRAASVLIRLDHVEQMVRHGGARAGVGLRGADVEGGGTPDASPRRRSRRRCAARARRRGRSCRSRSDRRVRPAAAARPDHRPSGSPQHAALQLGAASARSAGDAVRARRRERDRVEVGEQTGHLARCSGSPKRTAPWQATRAKRVARRRHLLAAADLLGSRAMSASRRSASVATSSAAGIAAAGSAVLNPSRSGNPRARAARAIDQHLRARRRRDPRAAPTQSPGSARRSPVTAQTLEARARAPHAGRRAPAAAHPAHDGQPSNACPTRRIAANVGRCATSCAIASAVIGSVIAGGRAPAPPLCIGRIYDARRATGCVVAVRNQCSHRCDAAGRNSGASPCASRRIA